MAVNIIFKEHRFQSRHFPITRTIKTMAVIVIYQATIIFT